MFQLLTTKVTRIFCCVCFISAAFMQSSLSMPVNNMNQNSNDSFVILRTVTITMNIFRQKCVHFSNAIQSFSDNRRANSSISVQKWIHTQTEKNLVNFVQFILFLRDFVGKLLNCNYATDIHKMLTNRAVTSSNWKIFARMN